MNDAYLVHGWKVGPPEIKRVLEDTPSEAFDRGICMVFAGKSMDVAFLGRVLSVKRSDEPFASTATPGPEQVESLKEGARSFGIAALDGREPELWTVLG